jgi:hypothetical protein
MSNSPIVLGGVAGILLAIGAANARADLIQWSYSWSRSPAEVQSSNHGGAGYISLTDDGLKSASGNSNLAATNLQGHSTASTSDPDVFTNKAYTLSLFLQDQDSKKSGTLAFNGQFNGTLTADSSNITNTFTGDTTQKLVLGDHLYTVTIGPYSAPGPPGAVNSGSIAARAEVTVSLLSLPEPSSFVLAFVGAAGGLVFGRKQRFTAYRGESRPARSS